MEVLFSEYRFLRDQLTLYKDNEIVPLKHTQALLLNFFLENPESVHSKETIMNAVWQNKDVSEQVVFQTISQLRAILGADAIKTYSKKGYKWQLALQQKSLTQTTQKVTKKAIAASKHTGRKLWPTLIVGVVIVIGWYLLETFNTQQQVVMHYVEKANNSGTTSQQLSDLNKNILIESDRFLIKFLPKTSSTMQLFEAPSHAWKKSNIPAQDWLLWTETSQSEKGIFLHYGLSKDAVYWTGYLFAKTYEQLTQKMFERLQQLHHLGLFSLTSNNLDISVLTSMMKIAPDDPDVLLLLTKHYFNAHQLEVAMTYAQKLANLESSYSYTPYKAQALWQMSEVYKRHQKFQLAANSLDKMSEAITDAPLPLLRFKYFNSQAWIAKALGKFDDMFNTLEQGLEFARKQAIPLMQFELQITYSILAKKASDHHKKYTHLNEAQALLLKHKLDESNAAVVYYHFAIFTQDTAKAQPYLEKILTLPRTIRNGWIIDDATEKLVDQYIEQKNYHLAKSILVDLPESPKYMLSRAKLSHATNERDKALMYYEKAFELSRLEHDRHLGVHAAFGLYQLHDQQPKIQAEYWDYLERNALKEWLNEQMEAIKNRQ